MTRCFPNHWASLLLRSRSCFRLILPCLPQSRAGEKTPAAAAPSRLEGIVPADRLADWSHAGVPGGIRERNDLSGIINVQKAPYMAAGSAKCTTGTIEAGSNLLEREAYVVRGTELAALWPGHRVQQERDSRASAVRGNGQTPRER